MMVSFKDLTQEQLDMIFNYCDNDMYRLKQICNPIIARKNVPQMYYDDLLCVAQDTLVESIKSFNSTRNCQFKTYLIGNIKRAFYDWTRDNFYRAKRNNLQVDKDGKIAKDEKGKPIIVQNISLDEKVEDDLGWFEKIASDFEIENNLSEEMCLSLGENTQNYLNVLGATQRKIAELIMEDYNSSEIKEKLNLSDKEYSIYMSDMKIYEKKKLLKEEDCDFEEDIIMSTVTTTSEKTKNTSYAISAIEKKLRRNQWRDNHVLQRVSGQHSLIIKSEFMSDILQGRALTQIIVSEEIKDGVTMYWLIDGKQRCTNIIDFMNDGFAISKNVQIYNISYQTEKLDEDGNIIHNNEGFPIPEVKIFDIRGKKFSQLPDELQDRFKEYQIPVLLNLNCTKKGIAYDIARFNRCRPMNKAQNGWTGLDEAYAEYVDNILKMDFFKIDCKKTKFTKDNIKSGAMRRMIIEAIITSRYIEEYSGDVSKMCKYLNNEASESVFIDFYALIERLNSVLTDKTFSLFVIKNAYLWIALFDKFSELNVDDKKFGEFILEFNNTLCNKKVGNFTYTELDESMGTKKKSTTKQKLNHLYTLLLDYLHINKEEIENAPNKTEDDEMSTLDFIKENVSEDTTKDELEFYKDVLDGLTLEVDNNTKLLEDKNNKSLMAMVAYSFKNDIDLDSWLPDFFSRNNTYILNQKENYSMMVHDLNNYIRRGGNNVHTN